MTESVGKALESLGQAEADAQVVLSQELVALLSAQLYQSPIKAIEELVVNSYDADANVCRVLVTSDRILVLDDGIAMDAAGVASLWHIGHSNKRDDDIIKARQRKQIGKFGIGKLASAALAERVTYITKVVGASQRDVLSSSVRFGDFQSAPSGVAAPPVHLNVRRVTVDDVLTQPRVEEDLRALGVNPDDLRPNDASWTLVILEELKAESSEVKQGRLRWVLSTAMPLASGFQLFLGQDEVKSSKQDAERIGSFLLSELPATRLSSLTAGTGEEWRVEDSLIKSPTFPEGISGEAFITKQSLFGKSDDLQRSHGFFVKVRGRLINIEDPLFGLKPSSHQILNRFYCEIEADDLDKALTAPREGVESNVVRSRFIALLNEIFNEARTLYTEWERRNQDKDKKQVEDERNYVNPSMVERPVADALLRAAEDAAVERAQEGATFPVRLDGDGDESAALRSVSQDVAKAGWFYLTFPEDFDLDELTKSLYSDERESLYKYEKVSLGRGEPMVRFDPSNCVFRLNTDHDLVRAHDDQPAAQKLLQDVVTAEAILEIYLREDGMSPQRVEDILIRRDTLLRSLTQDRVYSLKTIAADLRDAKDNEHDLEVQLVIAARALGFSAKHIGGVGEPDGLAWLTRTPKKEAKITLEAKSSVKVSAGLGAIDFAGLEQHMKDHEARGCLLVAPGYPGGSLGENAAAAKRAREAKVSCWTVEQLASVVELAEERRITASQVFDIIKKEFEPEHVDAAVKKLLEEPTYSEVALYEAIVRALDSLQGRMRDTARTSQHIYTEVTREDAFRDVSEDAIKKALRDLMAASSGGLVYDGQADRIVVQVSLEELNRRVATMLGKPGVPRHRGGFVEMS